MKNTNVPIRVLIADDHKIVRAGLAALLGTEKDIEVVGFAENGRDAVAQAMKLQPDVVIMDLMMPVMDGVRATEKIIQNHPETRIVILTTYTSSDDISRALSAGALGALAKTANNAELVAAIRSVVQGKQYISPEIAQTLEDDPPTRELTAKQLDILHAVTRGLTNDEIANMLEISPNSVKKQLKSIFAKLGVATRAEAATIALRKHLLKI